jgi:hypothetical protein
LPTLSNFTSEFLPTLSDFTSEFLPTISVFTSEFWPTLKNEETWFRIPTNASGNRFLQLHEFY